MRSPEQVRNSVRAFLLTLDRVSGSVRIDGLAAPEEVPKSSKPRLSGRQKAGRLAAGLAVFLAVEAFFPPSWQPSAHLCVGMIRIYQATVSPLLRKAGAKCRFTPTCSHYGVGAIQKYGTLSGGVRTAGRIVRCAPWGPPPGEDLP